MFSGHHFGQKDGTNLGSIESSPRYLWINNVYLVFHSTNSIICWSNCDHNIRTCTIFSTLLFKLVVQTDRRFFDVYITCIFNSTFRVGNSKQSCTIVVNTLDKYQLFLNSVCQITTAARTTMIHFSLLVQNYLFFFEERKIN